VVVDAALMLDWGFQRDCDVVLAVVAPDAQHFQRLLADRGWPPEESAARLAAQPTREQFEHAADEILVNDGTPEDLSRKIAAVWNRLAMRRA
jgi:dephospho-CoA kinase